jgi:hypothetical protein
VAAIAKALAQKVQLNPTQIETTKHIIMFCAAGLLVALLFATYGLDLTVGFF